MPRRALLPGRGRIIHAPITIASSSGTGGSNKAVRTGFHAAMPSALTIEFTGIGPAVGACAGIVFAPLVLAGR
jgi:hypothetical protein